MNGGRDETLLRRFETHNYRWINISLRLRAVLKRSNFEQKRGMAK